MIAKIAKAFLSRTKKWQVVKTISEIFFEVIIFGQKCGYYVIFMLEVC
jgi:hypothetical protein